MRILKFTREPDNGRGQSKLLAKFDVQIAPDVAVRNMFLRQRPDGEYRVFSPNHQGVHVVSFSPEFADAITAAALAALEANADATAA